MTDGRGDASAQTIASSLVPKLAQFIAVAEVEHITKAAAQLDVPQPTMSRSIAKLEEVLGVELLVRQGRRVKLTHAGRTFAVHVRGALEQLADGVVETRAAVEPSRGRIGFGFPLTMGGDGVPRLLRDFRAANPEVELVLVQGNGDHLLASLRDGTADLCLISPPPKAADIISVTAQIQPLQLLLPRGHRLAGEHAVRLSELQDEKFVAFPDHYWISTIVRGLCARAGFDPSIVMRSGESETIRGLVSAGVGVAVMPPVGASRWPGIAAVDLTDHGAVREIGLICSRDRELSAAAAAFREFILAGRPRYFGTAGEHRRPHPRRGAAGRHPTAGVR